MNTSQWQKISLMTCHFDPDCPTVPVVPVIYIGVRKISAYITQFLEGSCYFTGTLGHLPLRL